MRHNQASDTIPFVYQILCHIIMPRLKEEVIRKALERKNAPREQVSLHSNNSTLSLGQEAKSRSLSLISL